MRHSKFDFVVIGGGIVGSTLADSLAVRGARVALIERGSATLGGLTSPKPEIHFTHRKHLGCEQARNHVLGGNGYFWGGGLIRPPSVDVLECLGFGRRRGPAGGDLSAFFASIERTVGLGQAPGRMPFPVKDSRIGSCHLAEMVVLPGRLRNISRPALRRLASAHGSEILCGSEVIEFVPTLGQSKVRTISSVIVRSGGTTRSIFGRRFVISAGAIDSNLLVLAHAASLGLAERLSEIGSQIHDHLSIPIARVHLRREEKIRELLAPQFRGSTLVGRRFELSCEHGWGARGFLHFQFLFDEVSPYREIKNLLALRQQTGSVFELARVTLPLFAEAPELLKIGIDRVFKKRLHISDGLSVVATLDFETRPSDEQKLSLVADRAEFSWRIGKADEETFLELSGKALRLVSELADTHGMEVAATKDFGGVKERQSYLREKAIDAFHLGGGLKAGLNGDGLVDSNLRLVGTQNVYVIASSTFRRPGVVNPTHTLLALADRFVAGQFA